MREVVEGTESPLVGTIHQNGFECELCGVAAL